MLPAQPGTVVAERFRVEHLAGSGGMGLVFKAHDLATGKTVALKLLSGGLRQAARFAREAAILAELEHPAIVRFVAHGTLGDETPYLAMEWIDGPTLGERLDDGRLTIGETVQLGTRLAEGLAVAHRRGVIHRDLKPANIALEGGALERSKLLDFGVARWLDEAASLTVTGDLVGTPAYMSPEQVRGVSQLRPASDVFSLGCLLYECLTGARAFDAPRSHATMAKILFDPVPPLVERCPDVPPALDDLVGRMLAKEPQDRPPDGAAVAAALAAHDGAALAELPAPPKIRTRRLVSVVLAPGLDPASMQTQMGTQPTVDSLDQLDASMYGATAEVMRDGTLVAVLRSDGDAAQLCTRAARLGLRMHRTLNARVVAIATGRTTARGRRPGDVFEAASRVLELRPDASGVLVDEVTRDLLATRFDVADGVVRGERLGSEVHAVHGRVLPCLGRDAELAALEAAFAHSVDESVPRAFLVTAPPGVGKTRLAAELLRRLRERGPAFEVWTAHGDPMSAGSPYAILDGARGLRLGKEVEAIEERPPPLRPTGLEPGFVAEHLALAWRDWLSKRCREAPVLLLLDDLHWGDLPSVKTVEAALLDLTDRPLMVLAMARPEVSTVFPRLWTRCGVNELRLPGLGRRAAERLASEALGDAASTSVIERIVVAGAGNAFFLEELVRAHVDGSGTTPETILATVQARLDHLSERARRVLCAASVVGQTVAPADVGPLVPDFTSGDLVEIFEELLAEEALDEVRGSDAFTFRHALIHECVYASLPEVDRKRAHQIVGEQLAAGRRADALVVAGHLERAGDLAAAAVWLVRAGETALRACDFDGAIAMARRAAEHAAGDETRGLAHNVEAASLMWGPQDDASGLALARRALALLPPGTESWYRAIETFLMLASRSGHYGEVAAAVQDLIARPVAPETARAHARALIAGLGEMELAGVTGEIERGLRRVDELTAAAPAGDLDLRAWRRQLDALVAVEAGDVGRAIAAFEESMAAFRELGNLASARSNQQNLGFLRSELGDLEAAEGDLRAVLEAGERAGSVDHVARQNLGLVLARLGRLDEARVLLEETLATSERAGQVRLASLSRIYLSQLHLQAGEVARATAEAARAAEALVDVPGVRVFALGQLGRALLAEGRAAEALAATTEAMAARPIGGLPEGDALLRLAHTEALFATGRLDEARAAAADSKAWLLSRADRLDARQRATFLAVPENARLLALSS